MKNKYIIKDFKIGQKVLIKQKPPDWSSKLSENTPFNLDYPFEGIIEDLLIADYTALKINNYGFYLDSLILTENIEIIPEEKFEVSKEIINTKLYKYLK